MSFGSLLSGVASVFTGGGRQEPANGTTTTNNQRAKRGRPDDDETDAAFCLLTRTMEGPEIAIDNWSPENKTKLAQMLSMYLGFQGASSSTAGGNNNNSTTTQQESGSSPQDGSNVGQSLEKKDNDLSSTSQVPGIQHFAGAARSDQHLRDTTSRMMVTLASAKETLKNLVPRSDTDNLSKAPTYEKPILTFEIDSFLYENDEEIDQELVDPGHVSRNYCTKCESSTSVTTTRFISHSFSRHQLAFIFVHLVPRFVLPDLLRGQKASRGGGGNPPSLRFLDVGSRFGTVPLAAACCLREEDGWVSIDGIEINPKYFNLSNTVLGSAKNKVAASEEAGSGGGRRMMDRTFFPEGTLSSTSLARVHLQQGCFLQNLDMMKEASLICLNNVFEWHMETDKLLEAWKSVRRVSMESSKTHFFVTSPSIEDSLDPLFRNKEMFVDEFPPEVNAFVKEWGLKKIDTAKEGLFFTRCFFDADAEEQDEEHIQPIHLYVLDPAAVAAQREAARTVAEEPQLMDATEDVTSLSKEE